MDIQGLVAARPLPDGLFHVQTWIAEMAAFVKSIAPMQLLGVGDEGFATNLNNQDSDALVASNPGSCPSRLK